MQKEREVHKRRELERDHEFHGMRDRHESELESLARERERIKRDYEREAKEVTKLTTEVDRLMRQVDEDRRELDLEHARYLK